MDASRRYDNASQTLFQKAVRFCIQQQKQSSQQQPQEQTQNSEAAAAAV